MPTTGGERGQASVELMAVLPLVLVLVALAWQAAVAGQAVWLSGAAARAAARAHAIGADPLAAARASLPPALSHLVRVHAAGDGAISLSLGVPAVVGGTRLATVHARARFAPQRGRGR
jgi:hypothetical protein